MTLNKLIQISTYVGLITIASAQIMPTFKRLDKDRNDKISAEESDKVDLVKDNFEALDTDKDGDISEKEYEKLRDLVKAKNEVKKKERDEKAKRDAQDDRRRDR